LAYGIVLVVAFCVTVFAPGPRSGVNGERASALDSPLWWLVYLLPIAAAVFIARTATIVDDAGITVRALLGRRRLPWGDVRGLSVTGRSVYAVADDGAVRLPCVRVSDLAALSGASGGHVPQLAEAPPKYAPSRHPRR